MTDLLVFGPKDEAEAKVFAEEGLRVDAQVLIHELMLSTGVDKAELARRIDCDDWFVDEMFEDHYEMSIRDLALICWALGRRVKISLD